MDILTVLSEIVQNHDNYDYCNCICGLAKTLSRRLI
jgi:hypothetical protein